MEEKREHRKDPIALNAPVAIIIAGIIIAVAIFFTKGGNTRVDNDQNNKQPQQAQSVGAMRPVSADDHIMGDSNADTIIVEYSDTECPFCKMFHQTMQKIMSEYKGKGVAWVYRNAPIDQLHPKSRKEAEAAECAGSIGGNDKYWSYLNRIFEITPSNNGLDAGELPKIADYVGIDKSLFTSCLASGKFANKVSADVKDATSAANNNLGTPYSVIISKKGNKYPIMGAEPYETVKSTLDTAIKDK